MSWTLWILLAWLAVNFIIGFVLLLVEIRRTILP